MNLICRSRTRGGSDNVIADHLSRLEKPTGDKRGNEIEENFHDE